MGFLTFQDRRIIVKLAAIIGLFSLFAIGGIGVSLSNLKAADDAYTRLLRQDTQAAMLFTTANKAVASYLADAYHLLVVTSDEDNARLLKSNRDHQHAYESLVAEASRLVPQHASITGPATAAYAAAFAACAPAVEFAATTTTAQDNAKAAERLDKECSPMAEKARLAQTAAVDALVRGARQDADALSTRMSETIFIVIGVSVLGLLSALGLALTIGIGGLARPLGRLNEVMARLARNDLTAEVPGVERGDELGAMARTVEVFKSAAQEVERLRQANDESRRMAEAAQSAAMRRTADGFERKVGSLVTTLGAAAEQLRHTAEGMSATASDTTEHASAVAAAAEEAGSGASTVAAAAEQLTVSIDEINRQVSQSAEITQQAVNNARRTDTMVQHLADSAQKIGEVVSLITNIASQTNLLALNATIEAARAGDAGKGFAVVASEVKSLAQQTTKATESISAQISTIQQATAEAVTAIQTITTTIERVSEISTSIASAVEEQGAATAEISRNVQQSAASTQEVGSTIARVSQGATSTGTAAGEVLQAAEMLAGRTRDLSTEVSAFLTDIRQAA